MVVSNCIAEFPRGIPGIRKAMSVGSSPVPFAIEDKLTTSNDLKTLSFGLPSEPIANGRFGGACLTTAWPGGAVGLNTHYIDLARKVMRATRTVLFVDVVESVRLIEQDEQGVVSRWLGFVEHVESHLLPGHHGRLVKSLGDGMLIEFLDVKSAVAAALEMQEASHHENLSVLADQQMLLRMGVEVSDILIDQRDVYGRGVNLAARLTNLAGPGEIVVSARVRDQLAMIDGDIEDLGECFLRHLQQPVRCFRIGGAGPHPVIRPGMNLGELLPSVAIIPLTSHDPAPDHQVLGEVVAEEMIGLLSRSQFVHVISRLSTTQFRGRSINPQEISKHLSADYVLSGVYRVDDKHIVVDAELEEVRSARIVWSQRFDDEVGHVISGGLIGRAAAEVYSAMMSRELQRTRSHALPTLESYTLLMAAIALMHRMSLRDFEDAYQMLQLVVDRTSRQPIPWAWIAKWYVLRVQQGWSDDWKRDTYRALECTKRALDADPRCSLALAIDGLVHTQMLKRLDLAEERYEGAISSNPSNSIAWLLKGTMHAFRGEGQLAVDHTERAIRLSPLDPHHYFYDSLAATAQLAAHQYQNALTLAQRSYRANRFHASTLRVMAISQWQLGLCDHARKTVQELLKLDPTLTIKRYLERSPAAPYNTGKEWAGALGRAGVPQ